jgi:hypothetical protein
MKKSEIDEYRRSIESDYSSNDKEIETSTSYISTALIGFFITANEKKLLVGESECKGLFVIGILLLIISIGAILTRKYYNKKNSLELLDQISKMKKEDETEKEKQLYRIWEKGYKRSQCFLFIAFSSLISGIIISVLYNLINL